MDVLRIFYNGNLGSYYKFLVKYEPEYRIRVGEDEEKVIEFVSKKLANGKRIHELRLLKRMLTYTQGVALFHGLQTDLDHDYGIHLNQNQMENIVNVMTNKILKELVEFGISRYERDFSNTYRNTNFVLYQKYTYEDVCRLLNWERNEVPLNIGGYKFDKKTKTFPMFINYDKAKDISDTTKYEDHFAGNHTLIAISKSGRSVNSEDVQNFLHAQERGIQVHLFVRKNKDDSISKEFYYLGNMRASGKCREFIMPKTDKKAVEIEWLLDVPVREDIYEYIVNA